MRIASPGRISPPAITTPMMPALRDEVAVFVASQRRPHQPRPNAVELGARVAQTSNLDDRRATEIESRASRQPQQIDAARRHVLTHLSGRNGKTLFPQRVVQLGV